jgi:segregation and condensation protein A
LLQYRAFKQVSVWFENSLAIESERIGQVPQLDETLLRTRPELVWNTALSDFAALAESALGHKEAPLVGLSHLHATRVTIREQATLLIERLRSGRALGFRELLATSDRTVFVARFLAILELYRRSAITFQQPKAFVDFDVEWIGDELPAESLANLWEEYEQ